MIFSGRPNPAFVIDDPKVVAQLKHLLRQLPKGSAAAQGRAVSPDKLGDTGFVVRDVANAASDPVSFVVYGSGVDLALPVVAGAPKGVSRGRAVHQDAGRALEQLLIDAGKAKGQVGETMEKRIKAAR
ncbi:MAG TPA: hypothetical protein VHO24_09600 [Opitutaceae bacterium]|nr:hypothetical protein [Opitutaceae bacterium]